VPTRRTKALATLATVVGLGVAAALAKAELARRSTRTPARGARGSGKRSRERPSSRLRLLTLEQLDLAIALLEGREQTPPEQSVHETRKALKRARALVRLQRDSLGAKRFARENAALREAGQRLAGARDSEVMVEALERLVHRHPKRLAVSPGVSELRARLIAERERSGARTEEGAHARETVLAQLRAARRRLASWEPRVGDRKTARAGLRRLYLQGRRRRRRARRAQSSAALHQWRKRAKDLRYAAEMLDGRDKQQRKRLRRIARRADHLGETLGEEHDLALLAEQVRVHRDCFKGEKATRRTLERAIERRRERLRARAWRLGERLYRRKPGRFVRRALGA
jgi:CHAD domain-containing protein